MYDSVSFATFFLIVFLCLEVDCLVGCRFSCLICLIILGTSKSCMVCHPVDIGFDATFVQCDPICLNGINHPRIRAMQVCGCLVSHESFNTPL